MRNSWFVVWTVAVAAAVAGCATAPGTADDAQAPAFRVPAPLPGAAIALVLSGGAARGFAHVGVIKALEAHGLRPDMIVGSSAGSIVGALYASGLSAAELEAAIARLDASAFSEVALPGVLFFPSPLGIVRGDGLMRYVEREARHRRIEDFPIRFAAVATDLASGTPQIFNTGDAACAVAASSAVPGMITPQRIRGRLFGDGQLSSPLPVAAARALGARVVIAVDVIYPPKDSSLTSIPRILSQGFLITVHRLKEWEAAAANLVLAPELGHTSEQWFFEERERLVAAGEAATLRMLDRLRPLFPGAQPRPP